MLNNEDGNSIHPTAIIDSRVVMGHSNVVGPNVVLYGPLLIGNNNIFTAGAVVGTPGENTRDPRRDVSDAPIVIGSDCIFKEYVVVQKPCFGRTTSIGDRVFLMHGAHVAHDCVLEEDVVMTPGVQLAGIVTICRGANLAMSCQIHQKCVVGDYSIAGMGASVVKNIKPFSRYIPGKPISINEYAIEKFGFNPLKEQISDYVIRDIVPFDPHLKNVVDRFTLLSEQSGKKTYL